MERENRFRVERAGPGLQPFHVGLHRPRGLDCTAQLIDAHSDEHVWAEQYDRELAGVLEIQSEVARAVSAQIWG